MTSPSPEKVYQSTGYRGEGHSRVLIPRARHKLSRSCRKADSIVITSGSFAARNLLSSALWNGLSQQQRFHTVREQIPRFARDDKMQKGASVYGTT